MDISWNEKTATERPVISLINQFRPGSQLSKRPGGKMR
jgi:hypothetical protein